MCGAAASTLFLHLVKEFCMTIFTIEKLYSAYKECLKNKKHTVNALKFELDREKLLFQLLRELKNRTYKISRHICFIVTEPSPREIFAGDFRDRIVQHLLCAEIEPFFDKKFSKHSYANRMGMGTHKAMRKSRWIVCRGGQNGLPLYFLKMDIKGFFRNMNKPILFQRLQEIITILPKSATWKEEVLWLAEKIILHDPTSNYLFKGKKSELLLIPPHKSLFFGERTKGLPIGNLTSQFFANVYLDLLDEFIEQELQINRYVRYVDDFVLFHESVIVLKYVQKRIEQFLGSKLALFACKDKTIIKNTKTGIDFLGYFIKPTHTLVRRKIVRRF